MQDCIATGISFKKDLISKIDSERGDVPRSKFIQRILERYYYLVQEPQKEEEKNIKFDSSGSTTAAKQKEGPDESSTNT